MLCFVQKRMSKLGRLIWETKCEKGLFPVQDEKIPETVSLVSSGNLGKKYGLWHSAVGHISSEKYQALSKKFDEVPFFPRPIIRIFQWVPRITAKTNKAPIRALNRAFSLSTEIHYHLSAPFMESLNKNKYALNILDTKTSYSEAFALPVKSHATSLIQGFVPRVNNKSLTELFPICLLRSDNAKENISQELQQYCERNGTHIQPSPANLIESNKTAKKLVQEHWTRARVMITETKLPSELWDEALHYANWLRYRLPSARINFSILAQNLDSTCEIDFKQIPELGSQSFAFLYYPHHTKHKKVLPQSESAHLLPYEGEQHVIRVYIPSTHSIRHFFCTDFYFMNSSPLPSLTVLLDGIA